MPPVIPDVFAGLQFQGKSRNAGFGGAVVQFNGDEIVAALDEFCDVEEIFGVAAFVFAGKQCQQIASKRLPSGPAHSER